MKIEVTKIKKGKTGKKEQEDIVKQIIDLIQAETKEREKAGFKVSISSEELEIGKAIASKLDIINYFASDFIMPLVTREFDVSNKKRLEYMRIINFKLSEIVDDMEKLLFGDFKLGEVEKNDNED